jgi:hypothetical protein
MIIILIIYMYPCSAITGYSAAIAQVESLTYAVIAQVAVQSADNPSLRII